MTGYKKNMKQDYILWEDSGKDNQRALRDKQSHY